MSSPDFAGTSRFELIRQLGEGGSGVVYEAFDRHQRVEVALKLLRQQEGAALLKFKDEFRGFCQLLPSIDSRNLVTLYELFEHARHVFFTMELIRGRPLVSYVRSHLDGSRNGPSSSSDQLDVVRLRSCFAQVARALSAIHSIGIVHCDIKPSNILVTDDERPVVLDFGLATVRSYEDIPDTLSARTRSTVFGTLAYMAPEQATSLAITPAADWYSFGVVLYQALTGVLPFTGSGLAVLDAKRWDTPTHPDELARGVPADLADLAIELLEPDPADRPTEDEILRCFRAVATNAFPRVVTTAASEPFVGRGEQLDALDAALDAHKRGKTLIVLVSGRSGMGKTGLIHRFIERASERERNLLVLQSRCYESESMPYKAIDPIVDALARHWKSLSDVRAASLVPQHATILARLFPVLRQIPAVTTAPLYGGDELDLFALRQHAADALRDLLWRLGPGRRSGSDAGADAPLVLTIDDAQWGDLDSVSILQQVLQVADPPPLLLIAACRSEDRNAAAFVEGLRAFSQSTPGPEVREIEVGPLSTSDARTLAVALTARMSDAQERIDTIGREAGGNLFFIHELARNARAGGSHTTLDGLVLERIDALPETARRFMIATVLSAQSLPSGVARAAAGLTRNDPEAFRVLLASHLVRTKGGADEPTFEPYHDRIREIVARKITGPDLRNWHLRLATAWENSAIARPETLVMHFQGAADDAKTRHYAAIAARNADEALAFDRAADFYELLVRLEDVPLRRPQWYEKQGEALANSGRGYEAAHAFRKALRDSPADDARHIEVKRRVATELIRAGYLDEAARELDDLLPQVGVRALRSEVRAFARLLWYRSLLACRGVGSRTRTLLEVPSDVLQRIDVLLSISEPLCLTSLVRGQALLTQGALWALRAGERHRVVRALTGLAASSSVGGSRTTRRSRRLLDAARVQLGATDDVWTEGRIALAEGIMLKLSGQFQEATARLAQAMEIFAQCRGVRWEVEAAQNLVHDSHLWMGEWNRLSIEISSRLQTAKQRGDLFAETYLKARTSPVLQLGADRIEQATLEVAKSLDDWVRRANEHQPRYDLQHRYALCTWLDIELYKGTPEAADAANSRLNHEWPRLRAVLLVFQFARIEMLCYRARIALAQAPQHGSQALQRANDDVRRLTHEGAAWAVALAQLIRASISHASGHRERAIRELESAEALLRQSHLLHYAAAAQYRRGRIIGGHVGNDLMSAAETWMRGQQMLNVERMSDLLAPGTW